MRKLLLAAVAFGGLTALAASGARPPFAAGVHRAQTQPMVTHVDYYHYHHHYHHRHYQHGHWHYWD